MYFSLRGCRFRTAQGRWHSRVDRSGKEAVIELCRVNGIRFVDWEFMNVPAAD